MKKDQNKSRNTRSGWGALSVAVLLLVVVLGSCTQEPLLSGEQPGKEYMDFTLELTPPGTFVPAETRAMTPTEQSAINRAVVLVYQKNKLLYHTMGTVTDIDGIRKRVRVTLKTSQSENDLFDIMVIGNPPGFNFSLYVGKVKEELKAALNAPAIGKWVAKEFIMWGEVVQTLVKPTTNIFKISMLRSLARIDIGVGAYREATGTWEGLSNFVLTEVRVVNARDQFAAIPAVTVPGAMGSIKVTAPTLPGGVRVQGKTAATAITYSGADITSVDKRGRYIQSTLFLAEAPNTTDRVTLLIGGAYKNGGTTFYRVDMCVPRTGMPGHFDYLPILRNYLYRISITKVSGDGFADPQEALNSSAINTVMTTELNPIEEGGMGDIIFDGSNYLMTDASDVLIYGKPDGVTPYTIATIKATFSAGVSATVTGTGIGTLNLKSGISETISAVIPAGTTTGRYTIKVGQLTKIIPLVVQPPVDAHFDFLPFQEVASIRVLNPQSWLTLSQSTTYKKADQQSDYITGDDAGKACFHFDENVATTGTPRTTRALVMRNNSRGTTHVIFEQLNLSGMVSGYFGGGVVGADGYTQKLAMESVEEYRKRIYDDTSIGKPVTGVAWGFIDITAGVASLSLGKSMTIALAKLPGGGVPPYTIYNTYAARSCYDKNRDIDGNGQIDDDEVFWYLPAQNQLMGTFITHTGITEFGNGYDYIFWSATGSGGIFSTFTRHDGATGSFSRSSLLYIRCVRDI